MEKDLKTRSEVVESDSMSGSKDNIAEKTVKNVANPDFAAAIGDNKPSPWGRGHLQLYACCVLVYLVSTMNGFDGSLMGSINALENYQRYYGLPINGASSTGIIFAIFNVGQMTGSLFIWVADWKGRRVPILVGCAGVLVGTVVTATAPTKAAFIGGRFLLSFFGTWATTAAPMYVVEIAPPLYRGTVSGLYNTLYYLGSIIATTAVLGAHDHLSSSNLDWRLPLWLQMLCPGIVCLGIWFLPESPRFLVATGRREEARAFFAKYHANGDAEHPIVALEMGEVEENLRESPLASFRSFFDLRVLVRTRARRYRTLLNVAFSWFGQFSGNNVISYYLPLLLTALNITNTRTLLLLNCMYALVGWIFATAGARCTDLLGRRPMFVGATLAMALTLALAAATAAVHVHAPDNNSAAAASVAFIYIFGAVFAFAFTAMQPVYPAEVMATDMRAKGMWLSQFTMGLAGFVNTFAAPIALQNIGYWFYVFFVFWDLGEAVVIYLFFVETKGRTLEEMDDVFEAPDPRKESLKQGGLRRRAVGRGEVVEA